MRNQHTNTVLKKLFGKCSRKVNKLPKLPYSLDFPTTKKVMARNEPCLRLGFHIFGAQITQGGPNICQFGRSPNMFPVFLILAQSF